MSEPPKCSYQHPARDLEDYDELDFHNLELGRTTLLPMQGHQSVLFPELNIVQPGLEKIIGPVSELLQPYRRAGNGEIVQDMRVSERSSVRSHFNRSVLKGEDKVEPKVSDEACGKDKAKEQKVQKSDAEVEKKDGSQCDQALNERADPLEKHGSLTI